MKQHWNISLLDVLSVIASERTKSGIRLELGVVVTGDSPDSYILRRDTVTLHKDCLTGINWFDYREVSIPYENIMGFDGIYMDIDVDDAGTPSVDIIPVLTYRRCCEKPLKFNMYRPKRNLKDILALAL